MKESATTQESGELTSCLNTRQRCQCASSNFTRIDGPWSWLIAVLLLSCVLFQNGCTSTYGILFPDILRDLKSTRALSAIPGSIAYANTYLLGIFIGKLCDHFGSRKILFFGGIISAIGIVTSSFTPNIIVLVVTFGFLLGTGNCMVYFSTILAVPIYFNKYKFEAFSLVSIGPGSSLLTMTPIVQNLNQSLGWRKSMQFMGGFSAIPLAVSILLRSIIPENTGLTEEIGRDEDCSCSLGNFCYFSALKIKSFLLAVAVLTVSALGHSMPFVHLAKVSEDIGIGSTRSSWLYFIIGFSSTISRLCVGKFAKSGSLSLPIISLFGNLLLALGNFILPSTPVFYALVLYSVGFGVGEGLMVTPIINTVLDSLPNDKRGRGYGLFQFITSTAYAIGPVLSGFIADISGSYTSAFYTAGVLGVLGGCLCILFRFVQSTKKDDNRDIYCLRDLTADLITVEKETVL